MICLPSFLSIGKGEGVCCVSPIQMLKPLLLRHFRRVVLFSTCAQAHYLFCVVCFLSLMGERMKKLHSSAAPDASRPQREAGRSQTEGHRRRRAADGGGPQTEAGRRRRRAADGGGPQTKARPRRRAGGRREWAAGGSGPQAGAERGRGRTADRGRQQTEARRRDRSEPQTEA